MRNIRRDARALLLGSFLCGCSLATACSSEGRRPTDGGNVSLVDLGSKSVTDGGTAGACSDEAKLVYVVDSNNDFLSFKPDTLTFTKIGTLNCPTFGGTPYSMGIDRTPTAWVLYSTGEVFKVSTANASCEATSFVMDQKGFHTFGMGFASNTSGSSDETLYVAGGLQFVDGSPASFGTLAFPALSIAKTGSVAGWPELTGTGEGKLWGFFPSATVTPKVSEIDKSTGASGTSFSLPSLSGTPSSWAFAFWGGDFFLFLQRQQDTSTNVYRVKGGTGTLSTALSNTGRNIVGAGVSTCAPTTIL